MFRLITIIVFINACSKDTLSPFCPTDCYGFSDDADPDTKGVGLCRAGVPTCDKDYKVIACDCEVLPTEEICDGEDNDCDYKVDEGWYNDESMEAYGSEDTCLPLGKCSQYRAVCVGGEFICPYQPQPEECDGVDNNCNAIVDEGLGNTEFCFDDDIWRATQGECRAGIKRCIEGDMVCDGQKLPRAETCDEKDNDCNGVIDDTGDVLSSLYDIVIVIDTSGSMCPYTEAVAGGLYQYLDQFQGNLNFRWALVDMSMAYGDNVQVVLDFTDMATVQAAVSAMGCDGIGSEASLDALYDTCSYNDSDLGLTWNTNANALVFSFTDEPAQTYVNPPTDGLMITDACLMNGVLPFQWSFNPEQFAPIVEPANGIHFTLSNEWESIFDDLNSIVVKLCEAQD